jgi:hypothetical protein
MVDSPSVGWSPAPGTDEVVSSTGFRAHANAPDVDVDVTDDTPALVAARAATRTLLRALAQGAPPLPTGDRRSDESAAELLDELARLPSLIAVLATTGTHRSAPDVERAAASLARALVEHGKEIAHGADSSSGRP